MIDIHSHILPGVDDGAANAQASLQMLRAAQSVGVTHIVATPHVHRRGPKQERIDQAMRTVRDMASFLGIQIIQGYEVNLQAIDPENMRDIRQYCFEGTDTLLLEMPEDSWPNNWEQILYRLQCIGLEIIIAHPERYKPLKRDFERVRTLVDMDCKLQIDASCMMGIWLNDERKLAHNILEQGLVSYVASDAHQSRHYATLQKALSKISRKYRNEFTMIGVESQNIEKRQYVQSSITR